MQRYTDHKPLLSIVAPAFNEEEVLPFFHDELMRVLARVGDEYEIEVIYVDDGSQDATPAVLTRLALIDSRVHFLRLSRNFGHQAALTAGLEFARGEVIVSMDSDLQHPPAVILDLLEGWKAGNDIVVTIREDDVSLGFLKKMTSRLFYAVMRYCSGMDVRPAAADFRLMSRKALDALLRMPERHRFIRGMVHWLGFATSEVNFLAPPRFKGKSKFTLVRMIRLARDGLLSFSRVPLHAALLFAGAMLLLSFLGTMGAWVAFRPEGSTGWLVLALILGAHLAGGAIWIALLAFSEYLARIHEQVLGRPLYVVRESSADLRKDTAAFPLNPRESRLEVA
ncbi:MAG: glycosyltransferase [Gemmataceae bacterium]|nr:glycosyltransferase [Gemmataceae bacterium]